LEELGGEAIAREDGFAMAVLKERAFPGEVDAIEPARPGCALGFEGCVVLTEIIFGFGSTDEGVGCAA
jgi:hypothetical protein